MVSTGNAAEGGCLGLNASQSRKLHTLIRVVHQGCLKLSCRVDAVPTPRDMPSAQGPNTQSIQSQRDSSLRTKSPQRTCRGSIDTGTPRSSGKARAPEALFALPLPWARSGRRYALRGRAGPHLGREVSADLATLGLEPSLDQGDNQLI